MPSAPTKYGAVWNTTDPLRIELACINKGGKWKLGNQELGSGLEHHYTEAIKLLWPNFHWHRWTRLMLKCFVEGKEIGVNGGGSTGKTFFSAAFGLVTYFARPKGTSVLMSTTTAAGLQLRIWGSVKELFNKAKTRHPWLPGNIIESKYMLTTDDVSDEARDFRDGLIGISCRVGGTWVGLSNYVGLKNDVVILIADEASLMGRGFLDAVPNLRKNPVFKLIGLGNPKDHTDCLGVISEPCAEDGGWPGFQYIEKTRTWKTRANGGIAIQLCGYDSPNYDYPRGVNPYVGIITPEQIEADLAYYGKDSLQFSMMNLGLYPRDGGSRRVITRMLCEKNFACEEVIWNGNDNITIAGLDAAYSGTGGDRCVLTIMRYGKDRTGKTILAFVVPPIIVPTGIQNRSAQTVEEIIADFCMEKCIEHGVEPHRFGLDSTGRGSLVSAFAQRWSPNVIAVEFGGRALDRPVSMEGDKRAEKDAYGKMVTALWFASRAIIESGQMRGLPQDVMDEGTMREWGINRDGKTDVETKDKTKVRMGRSPDLWDSLVVAIEVARRSGFQISNSSAAIVKPRMPQRILRLQERYREIEKSKQLSYA